MPENSSQNGIARNVSEHASHIGNGPKVSNVHSNRGKEFQAPTLQFTQVNAQSTPLSIPMKLTKELNDLLSSEKEPMPEFALTTSLAMDLLTTQFKSAPINDHPCESNQEDGISTSSIVRESNHRWKTSDPIERLKTLCQEAKESKLFEPSITRLGITSLFTAKELKQIKDELNNEPSSFESCQFKSERNQTIDSQSQTEAIKVTPKVALVDNRANLPRLPSDRNPRTQRIVELELNLEFHHEQMNQYANVPREPLFSPLELRISAPSYWTNAERQRVYRREPFVPTINDVNALVNGACNVSIEWINRQIHFMKSHQRDMVKSNDEWYALHCIRGCTYFNCAYTYYHYHVSSSNLLNFHSTTRWDIRFSNFHSTTRWDIKSMCSTSKMPPKFGIENGTMH